MNKKKTFFVLLCTGFFMTVLYCMSSHTRASFNLLVITVDTLRPDHLGCYGYTRINTPAIDSLSENGFFFTSAVCPMPSTTPSHASLFTSKYPHVHGVLYNCWQLSNRETTLAEIFHSYGYRTAAFVSSYALKGDYGLNQGFDVYNQDLSVKEKNRPLMERTAELTTHAVISWLERIKKQPFFLWVHYIDPHGPYTPGKAYLKKVLPSADSGIIPLGEKNSGPGFIPRYQILGSNQKVNYYIEHYNGEIVFVDEKIGELLNALKRLHLFQNTVIVFTADHGESLGEKGYYFQHGNTLDNAQLKIPLIIQIPGTRGRTINEVVSIVDIMPTVLDMFQMQTREPLQGESFFPLMQGEKSNDNRLVYAELPQKWVCAISSGWKLCYNIETKKTRLFSFSEDSPKDHEISAEKQKAVSTMMTALEQWLKKTNERHSLSVQKGISLKDKQRLRALGYFD